VTKCGAPNVILRSVGEQVVKNKIFTTPIIMNGRGGMVVGKPLGILVIFPVGAI